MSKRAKSAVAARVEERRWWERRGAVLLAGAAVFLFVFFGYAGSAWAAALYRLLTDGMILLLWVAAMVGLGAWVGKLFSSADERLGFATRAALGIGAYSLLILLFGWGGAMNRAVAWILMGLGIALGLVEIIWMGVSPSSGTPGEGRGGGSAEEDRGSKMEDGGGRLPSSILHPRSSLASNPHPNPPPAYRRRGQIGGSWFTERVEWTSWLWLIVVPFLAVAVLGALMPPGILWPDEPHYYDVVEYHLQVPREWYELGRIVALHHNVFSYFPFNVEVHYLLAMELRGGPWAGMYLAQLMHVAMMALAVAGLAELVGRKGRMGAVLAACTPWLALLAPVAYNEGGVLLFGGLAIGWAWKGLSAAEHRGRNMALAGVLAGFASGAKLTAVPMLLAGIPVAFGVASLMANQKGWLKPAIVFVACGVAVLSPWLIRNGVWAHNPVFPEAMSIFGRAHFTADQAERWRLAYVPPIAQRSIEGRLRAAWEQIFADWRYGFVLLPAGAFAFARGKMRRESLFLMALLLMWLVFWLFFTHLQSRFLVLAIPVMALLLSRIESPIGRLALVCAIVLQAGFGMLRLDKSVSEYIVKRSPFLGWEHCVPFLDERLASVFGGKGTLFLIGEAKAFEYEVPMSRLRYRTVFDVDDSGPDVVADWSHDWKRSQGDSTLIDFDELRRFAWKEGTGNGYWKIPAPPEGAKGRAILVFERE